MKKLFTLFVAAILAVGAYAQSAPTDTIKAVYAYEYAQGNAMVMWMADSTVSACYYVEIGQYDTVMHKQTIVGYIALPARYFAYNGVFAYDTKMLLTYGINYASLIAKGYTEAQAAPYKAGWETYVNADDLTLKPAFYYAIVAGYDASLQTKTEASAYNFFSIAEPTEGFENIFESKKPVKYMTPEGEVRIFRDGKIFNMSGALVQ